ncbi:MAG: TonB-dependent receptor [Cloacibacillus sp.]
MPSAGAVDLPPEVISSDSGSPMVLSPGAVTVVMPGERSGEQKNLPDLLEEVPGLQIIRLQGRHGYAVASIRGSTSAQVAVYVDGILANLQSEAAVDLSAIPVDTIERIEVYRGYIPARFGAQAMGGVINIITKMPAKPETRLSFGAGSFGRYKGILSHAARLGDGKFFGSFTRESYRGDFKYWNDNGTPYNDTDDYEAERRDNGFEKADLLLKWENENWRARASWVKNDRDLALEAPGIDRPYGLQRPGAILDTEKWDLSLGRRQKSGDVDWGWKTIYTHQTKDYDSRRGTAPSIIGGAYVTESKYKTERIGAAGDAAWRIGERHYIEVLAEFYEERLDVRGDMLYTYLNGKDRYRSRNWSGSLQDTISLDGGGTFLATPSVRWFSQDDTSHATWQIALSKAFSPAWTLRSTFGTYARAPNMYERYGDGAFILPAKGDLEWETGKQFDIGAAWHGVSGETQIKASLTGFWRESDNLIEFDMESPAYGRYKNIAKAKVKGVELETELESELWKLTLSGTWIRGTNETPNDSGSVRYYGKTLPNRPEWSGKARLTRKFERGQLFAEVQYIGENYADSSQKVLFDARTICGAGVKYKLSPVSTIIAGVDDIFNQADDWRMRPDGLNGPVRMLWYPVEGRTFYVTLETVL